MVSSQDASDLLRVLKQTETSIVQECSICHRRLEPAKCFKCEFCGLFVCERCQGTTSEVDPLAGSDAANRPADAAASESRPKSKPASKLLLCRACAPSLDASSSQKPTNPSIHPMFPKIVQDPYDPNSFLPAGWGIAMLPDGRRYFFNPLLYVLLPNFLPPGIFLFLTAYRLPRHFHIGQMNPKVFLRRQMLIENRRFNQAPCPPQNLPVIPHAVHSQYFCLSHRRFQVSQQKLEQSGFPGSVASEKAIDRSPLHSQTAVS